MKSKHGKRERLVSEKVEASPDGVFLPTWDNKTKRFRDKSGHFVSNVNLDSLIDDSLIDKLREACSHETVLLERRQGLKDGKHTGKEKNFKFVKPNGKWPLQNWYGDWEFSGRPKLHYDKKARRFRDENGKFVDIKKLRKPSTRRKLPQDMIDNLDRRAKERREKNRCSVGAYVPTEDVWAKEPKYVTFCTKMKNVQEIVIRSKDGTKNWSLTKEESNALLNEIFSNTNNCFRLEIDVDSGEMRCGDMGMFTGTSFIRSKVDEYIHNESNEYNENAEILMPKKKSSSKI